MPGISIPANMLPASIVFAENLPDDQRREKRADVKRRAAEARLLAERIQEVRQRIGEVDRELDAETARHVADCEPLQAELKKIEAKQISYKNINNKYLPFNIANSTKALQELSIDPAEAEYFDFSVEPVDNQTFRIIDRLKPHMVKKWYLHSSKTKFSLIYEKKAGEPGRLVQ